MQKEQNYPEIDKKRLINRLTELCRIAGPSRMEKKVADYILDIVRKSKTDRLKLYIYPQETVPPGGNTPDILLTIPGTGLGDPVLLSAHLDTVPLPSDEDVTVILKDGVLKTDGKSVLGGDDRAGVAAALEMMELGLAYPELHAGIEILFTVQEELGCLGSRNLDRSMISAKFGYNLDGETPPGSIITRAPRKARFTCEVHGLSSHAALAPEKGISAIKIAGRIIETLPQGRIDDDTTANTGMISGGRQTNIVPDYVRITGEVRSFSREGFNRVCADVEQVSKSVTRSSGGRVDVSWEHVYPGYSVNSSEQCIRLFTDACLKKGMEPRLLSSPGGGDSNNLNAHGIVNVVFGLGMHEIHTPNEYLVIEELLTAVEILKEILFPV